MTLGQEWTRELWRASRAAMAAPVTVIGAIVAIGIAGGFANLGALGQAVAGPPPAALPDTAQSAAQPQVIPASLLAAAGNVVPALTAAPPASARNLRPGSVRARQGLSGGARGPGARRRGAQA